MKTAQFVAHCPFEIGDIVRVEGIQEINSSVEFEIEDLLSVHSCRTGSVIFNAILNSLDGKMKDIELDVEHLELIRYGNRK